MINISSRGSYPAKSFKPIATKMWSKFFKIADPTVDVAHWLIEVNSATVRLSARQSAVDESGPAWEPLEPIRVLVDGVVELLNDASPGAERDGIRKSVRKWVERGILDAFESKRVQKRFKDFKAEHGFAIVTSSTDRGLLEDELSLIWGDRPSVSVSRIRSRQMSAQKKRKSGGKGRFVKKSRRPAT